jgi:hypothetical protein
VAVAFLRNRKKEIEAQRWILKLVNNHCPELRDLQDGPRLEGRVNLTVPAWVVPVEGRMPQIARAFPVVSKEFSPSGFSLVLNRPFSEEKVLVGFAWADEKTFLKGEVQHITSLGAGFSQLGILAQEVICLADYPELNVLSF